MVLIFLFLLVYEMVLIFATFSILLFCFQTDGSVPNTLVIANCEVVKPRVAAAEHISQVLITVWFIEFI